MNKYYYDFHIHSCLSPCADNDNTPNNIAGMGVVSGLNIMALTDHNTTKNCPAFFKAAKKNGIIPIAGMELTTAEDIHVVCLFSELSAAMEFDRVIEAKLIKIENRTDIFGEQLIMNENDEIIGSEKYLLSNATTVTIDETVNLAADFGGICYPAHIDRQANGILAVLGFFPPTPYFGCYELNDIEKLSEYSQKSDLEGKKALIGSDAHYLWDIKDKQAYIELEDSPYSSKLVTDNLFKFLR